MIGLNAMVIFFCIDSTSPSGLRRTAGRTKPPRYAKSYVRVERRGLWADLCSSSSRFSFPIPLSHFCLVAWTLGLTCLVSVPRAQKNFLQLASHHCCATPRCAFLEGVPVRLTLPDGVLVSGAEWMASLHDHSNVPQRRLHICIHVTTVAVSSLMLANYLNHTLLTTQSASFHGPSHCTAPIWEGGSRIWWCDSAKARTAWRLTSMIVYTGWHDSP